MSYWSFWWSGQCFLVGGLSSSTPSSGITIPQCGKETEVGDGALDSKSR